MAGSRQRGEEEKDWKHEAKRLRTEVSVILNAVEEAIEVADKEGVIRYVNPAYTRVTGIPSEERIGKNIFEISPQGALAQALLTQQPLVNHRTRVVGTEQESIVNAAPIVVNGVVEGAVVVFQPVGDFLRLSDEVQRRNTVIENLQARLAELTGGKYTWGDLAGSSKLFQSTIEMARRAARSNAPVLISGEPGTGKEIYAHALHNQSARASRPLVEVRCGEIPEALLEGEIFGYERHAFPGAVKTRLGKLELAAGGTVFFNEVGLLDEYLQERLEMVLQGKEFERVGGTETIRADVRVIASTNRDLRSMVKTGRFREELYRLLTSIEVAIPPLRERKEDILALSEHILARLTRRLGRRVHSLEPAALQVLQDYDWPGNMRELEIVLERAVVSAQGDMITPADLAGDIRPGEMEQVVELMPLDRMEMLMLKAALARFGDSLEGKRKAAQVLQISLATLYNKLKKYKANI